MPTVKSGVIYLQKDKLQLYTPFVNGVLEYRFPPDVIRDLDVVNLEALGNQIKVFINNGKIAPSNLMIVLCDNAYFVKDFLYQTPPAAVKPGQPPAAPGPKLTLEDLKKDADLFIEHVPYDNVVSKTFPLKNGIRVCAANQDLYNAIKLVFETLGFTVNSVLPGMVLGNNVSNRPVMDVAMANLILQRAGTVKQYDLLPQTAFEPQLASSVPEGGSDDGEVDEPQDPKKPNKKRLIAMSGLLATLIVVLILVYVQSQTPPTPPQQPAQAAPLAPAPAVSAAETKITTTAPDLTVLQQLSVQIVNASESAATAQTLRTALTKYKFKNMTVQTETSVGSVGTVVSFTPKTDQATRNVILDEIRKVKSDISVQEKQEGTVDITILLGK